MQWALKSNIPFVPKSGGHSPWSTIGSEGIIIDLSLYSDVRVDAGARTATVIGGVLAKEVSVRLAEAGFFTGIYEPLVIAHSDLFDVNPNMVNSHSTREWQQRWCHPVPAWWRGLDHQFHHRLRIGSDCGSPRNHSKRGAGRSYRGDAPGSALGIERGWSILRPGHSTHGSCAPLVATAETTGLDMGGGLYLPT